MNDSSTLVPPDSLDDSIIAPAPGPSQLRFVQARQLDRAIAMSIAGATALAGRFLGLVAFDLVTGIALLALGYLSIGIFLLSYRRSVRRGQAFSLTPWWLVLDVMFVGGLVALTGGLSSIWAVWYVACVGRAALMSGLRTAAIVVAGSALSYVSVLTLMGQIQGFDRGLGQALLQLTAIFGAAGILLVGTVKLRQSRQTIRGLHQESKEQVTELRRVTQDLEATSELLRDLTLTDALTGARNRRFFRERANAADPRQGRTERRMTARASEAGALMVDIDRFKEINDRFGHPVGDLVLKHVARAVRRCLRSEDTLFRWGGDEFMVLVAADAERTASVAQRVVEAVRAEPYQLAAHGSLRVTCSVGWAHADSHQGSADPLEATVHAADAALLRAKEEGRGRVGSTLGDQPRAVPMMMSAAN